MCLTITNKLPRRPLVALLCQLEWQTSFFQSIPHKASSIEKMLKGRKENKEAVTKDEEDMMTKDVMQMIKSFQGQLEI